MMRFADCKFGRANQKAPHTAHTVHPSCSTSTRQLRIRTVLYTATEILLARATTMRFVILLGLALFCITDARHLYKRNNEYGDERNNEYGDEVAPPAPAEGGEEPAPAPAEEAPAAVEQAAAAPESAPEVQASGY
ncbi:hypothetical protein Tcan_13036 [Toxocara canis]|uniref:Uncharacterized protein n=1 Tax=Toxocara canis TaxID=6265 RepID=A0A0B2URM2_TOXCA|nr:hypothetical protein Tcan_13036 [Toxocara canis]